jgi:hypothetical protein
VTSQEIADIFLFSQHGDLLGEATYFLSKERCKHFHWRVKQPEHVTDHKSPTGARVQKHNAILPPAHDFMPWCLLKHRKNLNLTLF